MHSRKRIDPATIRPMSTISAALAFLLFLFSFSIGPSFAENATTSLREVVVSASRVKEEKREVTSSISIISEEEIRASTSRDLGELLAEENIGAIRQYPGASTSVGMRGFRTDTHGNDLKGRVLILKDGRRAGTGNAAKIMTENIERIEIIRGPASAQYGSAAIGGVINVITKQGEGDPEGFAQGRLGSFGYEKYGAGISGEKKGFDFSATVSRSTMDDYTTGDGDKYENTGYDSKENVSLNLGYEFLPNNRIGLTYSGYQADEVGSPGATYNPTPEAFVDQSLESVDLVYEGATREGLFSWQARYFRGEEEYDFLDPEPAEDTYSERNTDQEGAQGQISWEPGRYRLTGGIDWVEYEIDSSGKYEWLGNFYEYTDEYEYDNPSYYLMGKAGFMEERLIFSGGLRYDQYEVEDKEQDISDDDSHLSPSLGASYFVLDNLKLRTNYSQGFRMPTAEETSGGGNYKPNYDLDPEKSENYEIGLDFYRGALDSSLTFFYSEAEDQIVSESINDPNYGFQYKNVEEATVSGIEGGLSYDLGMPFNWDWRIEPYLDLTYLTKLEDEETGEDLLYTPELNLSYGLSLSDYQGLRANLDFSYIGEQEVEDFSKDDNPRTEKGGYTVANLSLEKRLVELDSYGDLTMRGEVRNLLDKQYSHVEGYPMPGRSFYLGLRYNY